MVIFRSTTFCVTTSNPDSFSSSETGGLIVEKEAEKSICLKELDVRKALGASISPRSEELGLYNLV